MVFQCIFRANIIEPYIKSKNVKVSEKTTINMHQKKDNKIQCFLDISENNSKMEDKFQTKRKQRNMHARLYFVVAHFPLFFCMLSTPKKKKCRKIACSVIFINKSLKFED